MKKIILFSSVLLLGHSALRAQGCSIQIQILENKYMFGTAEKQEGTQDVKKMGVSFTSEVMEVMLPTEDGVYLIKVVNQDCQAYCSRDKRVRQLHSGDEKLVRNLFTDREDEILAQIRKCHT